MTIFGRQPALWIGTIVTIILGAVSTLAGEGIISDALQGRITDMVNAIAKLLVLLAPLIAGALIKPGVTPLAAPVLPAGTAVTTPAGTAATVEVAEPGTRRKSS